MSIPVALSTSYLFLLPLDISMQAIKSSGFTLLSSKSCQMFIIFCGSPLVVDFLREPPLSVQSYLRTVVQNGVAVKAAEDLMLLGAQKAQAHAVFSVEIGTEDKVEPPFVVLYLPLPFKVAPAVRARGNDKFHSVELMRLSVVKEHVLGRSRRVAEAVAEIEAELDPVDIAGQTAPIPGVFVSPDAPAPIEHGERLVGREIAPRSAYLEIARRGQAVELGVIIKSRVLFLERRGDHHVVFLRLGESDVRHERFSAAELGKFAIKPAVYPVVDEREFFPAYAQRNVAPLIGGGEARLAQRQQSHRHARLARARMRVHEIDARHGDIPYVREANAEVFYFCMRRGVSLCFKHFQYLDMHELLLMHLRIIIRNISVELMCSKKDI